MNRPFRRESVHQTLPTSRVKLSSVFCHLPQHQTKDKFSNQNFLYCPAHHPGSLWVGNQHIRLGLDLLFPKSAGWFFLLVADVSFSVWCHRLVCGLRRLRRCVGVFLPSLPANHPTRLLGLLAGVLRLDVADACEAVLQIRICLHL